MRLDVVVPTYNRAFLLLAALQGLVRAPIPPGLEVEIIVVDNNSKDDTRSAVHQLAQTSHIPVKYVFEVQQGKSHALNAGIQSSTAELIAFFDDDEQIGNAWYQTIANAFRDPTVEYVGGPYDPVFEIPAPRWLPPELYGSIGWLNYGETIAEFTPDFPGMALGGNTVFRRSLLDRIGYYNTAMGRVGTRLTGGEDDDMYRRLLASQARGLYLPQLRVQHFIPAARLTRKYLRSWKFWAAASIGINDYQDPQPVARLFGVPRYLLGNIARWPLHALKAALSRDPARIFLSEIFIWATAGFLYGRIRLAPLEALRKRPDAQRAKSASA